MAVPFVLRGAVPTRRGFRQPEYAAGSLVTLAHLLLGIVLYRPAGPMVSVMPESERVTYVDVPPPPSVGSARAVLQKARPVVVASNVEIPAATPVVEHPERLAGTQVLLAPREVRGLPAEAAGARDSTVNERDFSGRGVIGGVAGGKPPVVVSPQVAESLASLGAGDVHAPVAAPTEAERMAHARVVELPRMLNRDEVLRAMQNNYPAMLEQAGIEGTALVEVMVDTNGAVVPALTRVLQSTHPLFANAALATVARARFAPGIGEFQGQRIHLSARVRLPLRWVQQPH